MNKSILVASAGITALLLGTPVAAQTAGGEAAVEEIVVTAQKRSERLQDVPLAVSVVSGATLAASGAVNLEGAQYLVPTLNFRKSGTTINQSLFLRRGHAYVYFIYGMHFSVNVTSEVAGVGAGVLLRALEPIEGVGIMQARRGVSRLIDLARGPGRLAKAMAIDRELDGIDLCLPGPLWLATEVRPPGQIATSVRIGISKETARLLRFYERGNPHVSGSATLRK